MGAVLGLALTPAIGLVGTAHALVVQIARLVPAACVVLALHFGRVASAALALPAWPVVLKMLLRWLSTLCFALVHVKVNCVEANVLCSFMVDAYVCDMLAWSAVRADHRI